METIQPGTKLETTSELLARLRRKKTWLWNRLKTDPTFPRPIYLSPREPVFLQHEVDAWIADLAAKRGVEEARHEVA